MEFVIFICFSDLFCKFLEEEKWIYVENEVLIVIKLCKLLMMLKNKVISCEKLVYVKWEFGFFNDFMMNLVLKYSKYFRVVGEFEGKSFLELVLWEVYFTKFVIMTKAEEEERLIGIRVRFSFNWKLFFGFFIKKEMREWVRDWMEMFYVNFYDDAFRLDFVLREMEKRMIGVFYEFLFLSLFKRIFVLLLGKFIEDYRFSNVFSSLFIRYSGIFYMFLKGGI